jgi:hypothetical protein
MQAIDRRRVDNLVEVIREGIARRGFYILLDERAELICGKNGDGDWRRDSARIADFARRHGWAADVDLDTIMFWRIDAPAAKLDGLPSQQLFGKNGDRIRSCDDPSP